MRLSLLLIVTGVVSIALLLAFVDYSSSFKACLPLFSPHDDGSPDGTGGRVGTATSGVLFFMKPFRRYDGSLSAPPPTRLAPERTVAVTQPPGKEVVGCERWIVVSTIFAPSNALLLVDRGDQLLQGWCMVVVGDDKSPPPEEIKALLTSPRSIYLTPAEQEALEALTNSAAHTPHNSFSRKNLGYLFAIHMGARVILDLDDDNVPLPSVDAFHDRQAYPASLPDAVAMPPARDGHNNASGRVWNPYPWYRAPSAWPRGFPLDSLKHAPDPMTHVWPVEALPLGRHHKIMVEQYLADADPDVDAIYRLTQKLPLFFNHTQGGGGSKRVTALAPGVFTPFNAQATVVHEGAFWGLLLPATVHGRVSDIWRSFVLERVMWEVGGVVAFMDVGFRHERNPHNYLADLQSEGPLYQQAGPLIDFLAQWRLNPDEEDEAEGESQLPRYLLRLYVELFERGIVEKEDVERMRSWLWDLWRMGYQFPARVEPTTTMTPPEAPIPSPAIPSPLPPLPTPPPGTPTAVFGRVVLCLHFNFHPNETALELLYAYYSRFFARISVSATGSRPASLSQEVNYVECDQDDGWMEQRCLALHMKTVPDAEGWLFIADDLWVNLTRLVDLPRDRIWYPYEVPQLVDISLPSLPREGQFHRDNGLKTLRPHFDTMPDEWKRRLEVKFNKPFTAHFMNIGDLIYIPRHQSELFAAVFAHFDNPPTLMEMVVPLAVDIAVVDERRDVVTLKVAMLWEKARTFDNFVAKTLDNDMVHPCKLSQPEYAEFWQRTMEAIAQQLQVRFPSVRSQRSL